ncbi:hypothetical protein PMCN06_1351 [Pasteurella multocida subsp. multocida str. HN06]|nr:hypothetical protein PMCN06_1351 [Pasteurella multocida subsp. multocida str. HN06]
MFIALFCSYSLPYYLLSALPCVPYPVTFLYFKLNIHFSYQEIK